MSGVIDPKLSKDVKKGGMNLKLDPPSSTAPVGSVPMRDSKSQDEATRRLVKRSKSQEKVLRSRSGF